MNKLIKFKSVLATASNTVRFLRVQKQPENHSMIIISRMKKALLVLGSIFLLNTFAFSQAADSIPVMEYTEPQEFEIGGIKVTGANYSDDNAVIGIAGLKVGDKIRIPGGSIPKAMRALWKLRLFTDVQILKEKNHW